MVDTTITHSKLRLGIKFSRQRVISRFVLHLYSIFRGSIAVQGSASVTARHKMAPPYYTICSSLWGVGI